MTKKILAMSPFERPLKEAIKCEPIKYSTSGRVNKLLIYQGHKYIRNNKYGDNIYWKCTKWHNGCKARAITNIQDPTLCLLKNVHTHPFKTEC